MPGRAVPGLPIVQPARRRHGPDRTPSCRRLSSPPLSKHLAYLKRDGVTSDGAEAHASNRLVSFWRGLAKDRLAILLQHRCGVTRDQPLLVGWDDPDRDGRILDADQSFALRVARRIEERPRPARTIDDLDPSQPIVLADPG